MQSLQKLLYIFLITVIVTGVGPLFNLSFIWNNLLNFTSHNQINYLILFYYLNIFSFIGWEFYLQTCSTETWRVQEFEQIQQLEGNVPSKIESKETRAREILFYFYVCVELWWWKMRKLLCEFAIFCIFFCYILWIFVYF